MAVPDGFPDNYKKLDKISLVNKGAYNASTTYSNMDFVQYGGSSWMAKRDNLRGVTPAEGSSWTLLAKGYQTITGTDVQVTDTQGLTTASNKGKQTLLQTLLDPIANLVANQLMKTSAFQTELKKYLINAATANAEGFALDARYGKTLKDAVDTLNSGFRKDENTDYAVMGKSTDGNSYISFYDKSNILYQLLYNNDKIWFASNEGGNYNVKWELNPNWTKGTVTFSNGFTNAKGALWLNNSIKMALIKIECNIAMLNESGWITIATMSCHAKENTIDRIVLNDVNRDFQINGESISCYCEKGDSNKRLIITKMFLIN